MLGHRDYPAPQQHEHHFLDLKHDKRGHLTIQRPGCLCCVVSWGGDSKKSLSLQLAQKTLSLKLTEKVYDENDAEKNLLDTTDFLLCVVFHGFPIQFCPRN